MAISVCWLFGWSSSVVLTEISQLLSLKFVQRSMVIGSDSFVVLDLATNIQGPSRINSNNFGYNLFSLDCHLSSTFLSVCSLQAAGWSSCWFSAGSSCPGPAPVTVSATPRPAPSPAKPTTSCWSLKAFLLTASASSYRTIRSIAYSGATSAPTWSLSGSTPITSHTSSPPPSTASRCSRSWIWETTATCAPWLKTPFTGWVGSMPYTSTVVGSVPFLITSSKASETCSISTCRYTIQFHFDSFVTKTLLELPPFRSTNLNQHLFYFK